MTEQAGEELMCGAPDISIPLHNRHGEVVAHALIDAEDAAQAEHRWCLHSKGYVVRNAPRVNGVRGSMIRLHREILGLTRGDGLQVDHIDRAAKLDNRRSNLRVATNALNHQNRGSVRGSTSEHRGVYWAKREGKWEACAMLAGRHHHLGYFDREDDAAEAARAFRAEHMPFSVEDADVGQAA